MAWPKRARTVNWESGVLTTVERQPEEYPYPLEVYIREVER